MDNAAQGRDLTGMPRAMLSRVNDQAKNSCGQALAPHLARLTQRASRSGANLRQCRVDCRAAHGARRGGNCLMIGVLRFASVAALERCVIQLGGDGRQDCIDRPAVA